MHQFNVNDMKIFCNLCELPHVKSRDVQMFCEFGVCAECGYKFAEPYRKDWNNGWRPTSEVIYMYIVERREIEKSLRRKRC